MKGDGRIAKELAEELGLATSIQVNGRFMREISEEAVAALVEKERGNPTVFRRGNTLVRLQIYPGGASAEPLSPPQLKGLLDRAADFVNVNAQGGEFPARPPDDVVADILAQWDLPFPRLLGFSTVPLLLHDGRILSSSGYDPGSGLYLDLGSLSLGSQLSINQAVSYLLDDLLGDFPFADEASRAHALAMLLQPFVISLIDGAMPLYLIDAPSKGTGKGLLADVITGVVLGRAAEVIPPARNEEEVRKRITSILIGGTPMALLDNVTELRSPVLAALLTARLWTDRLLGRSEMVHVPNGTIWVATGNNVLLSDEMTRRVIPIRLDAGVECPEDRTGWRYPELLHWALEHRAKLITACLSIVQEWNDRGMPKGTETLGRFEGMVGVMGGILGVARVKGFLGNRSHLYTQADGETQEWRSFCLKWWDGYQERPATAGQLLTVAKDNNLLLDLWTGRSALSAQQRLGHALRKKRGRIFEEYSIQAAGTDPVNGNAAHKLERRSRDEKNTENTRNTGPTGEARASASGQNTGAEAQNTPHAGQNTPGADRSAPGVSGVSGFSEPGPQGGDPPARKRVSL